MDETSEPNETLDTVEPEDLTEEAAGSPRAAIAVLVVIVVLMVGAVWFGVSSGIISAGTPQSRAQDVTTELCTNKITWDPDVDGVEWYTGSCTPTGVSVTTAADALDAAGWELIEDPVETRIGDNAVLWRIEAALENELISVYGFDGEGENTDTLISVGDPTENPSKIGEYKDQTGFDGDRTDGVADTNTNTP